MNKSIYIVGPTASGKSSLAVMIAQKFGGEVISCDSRQIYRGLTIGTGKEPGTRSTSTRRGPHTRVAYMIDGIAHYMIDTHHPNTAYNAAKFVKKALRIQEDILARGKIPIICGGTLFWAQALSEKNIFDSTPPNHLLRAQLKKLSSAKLMRRLEISDPRRARDIRERNDHNNRPRLVRALEIVAACGTVPEITEFTFDPDTTLIIATDYPRLTLFSRIEKRMDTWFSDGIFDEIRALHKDMNVPWTRLESFGLEYKWCTRYVRGLISFEEMRRNTLRDLKKYAKRQQTWLNRWEKSDTKIYYCTTKTSASKLVSVFLKK